MDNSLNKGFSMLSLDSQPREVVPIPSAVDIPFTIRNSVFLEFYRDALRLKMVGLLNVEEERGLVVTSNDAILSVLERVGQHGINTPMTVTTFEPGYAPKLEEKVIVMNSFFKYKSMAEIQESDELAYDWIFIDPSYRLPIHGSESAEEFVKSNIKFLQTFGRLVIPLPSPMEVIGCNRNVALKDFDERVNLMSLLAIEPSQGGYPPQGIISVVGGDIVSEPLFDFNWFSGKRGVLDSAEVVVYSAYDYLMEQMRRLPLCPSLEAGLDDAQEFFSLGYFKVLEYVRKSEMVDICDVTINGSSPFPCKFTYVEPFAVPPEVFAPSPYLTKQHELVSVPLLRYNPFVMSRLTDEPIVRCTYVPKRDFRPSCYYVYFSNGKVGMALSESTYKGTVSWYATVRDFVYTPIECICNLVVVDVHFKSQLSFVQRMSQFMVMNRLYKFGLTFERFYPISELDGVVDLAERQEWIGVRFNLLWGEYTQPGFEIRGRYSPSISVRRSRVLHLSHDDPRLSGTLFDNGNSFHPLPPYVLRYDLESRVLVPFEKGCYLALPTYWPPDDDRRVAATMLAPRMHELMDMLELFFPTDFAHIDNETLVGLFAQNCDPMKMFNFVNLYPHAVRTIPGVGYARIGNLYSMRRFAWESQAEMTDKYRL